MRKIGNGAGGAERPNSLPTAKNARNFPHFSRFRENPSRKAQ
jgi:hypothetical protein